MRFKDIEKKVLFFVLNDFGLKYDQIVEGIDKLSLIKRDFTGVGCVAYFEGGIYDFGRDVSTFSSRVFLKSEKQVNGIGFVMFFDSGKVSALEWFTYDDELYNLDMGNFEIGINYALE